LRLSLFCSSPCQFRVAFQGSPDRALFAFLGETAFSGVRDEVGLSSSMSQGWPKQFKRFVSREMVGKT
jgi:hypothetical protein